jgi:predicted anti-sigma-YlaC factor YlaD
MEKSCKEIEKTLVDYADGRLPPDDSKKVTEHLSQCEECRKVLDALHKSLELADIIWTDGLAETETIRISTSRKVRKFYWLRYAAIAASILLAKRPKSPLPRLNVESPNQPALRGC